MSSSIASERGQSKNVESPVFQARRHHDTISKEVWLRWSKSLKVSESIMIGISWNLVSSPERLKDSSGPNFSQFRPKARIWGFCVPPWSQQTPWRWSTPWRGSCLGRSFTRSWEGPKMQYNFFFEICWREMGDTEMAVVQEVIRLRREWCGSLSGVYRRTVSLARFKLGDPLILYRS